MEPWDNTVMFWHNEQWWLMLGVTCLCLIGAFVYTWYRNKH